MAFQPRSLARLRASPVPSSALAIDELALAYWAHAESYYRKPDGTPTAEPAKIKLAIRPLHRLYGTTPAAGFGPKSLKTLRQSMVDSGLCRRPVNQRIAIIVRVFRPGVENELVSPAVYPALRSVEGLKAERSAAREGKAVLPVPDDLGGSPK